MIKHLLYGSYCLACSAVLSINSVAETLNFIPTQDSTLYESNNGVIANGSDESLFVGQTNQSQNTIRRSLLRFDLSTIPTGSTITDARLNLNMNKSISGANEINVHRLSANWGEGGSNSAGGGGGGTNSAENDATWIHRFFDTEKWQQAGGDFESIASASQTVTTVGQYEWTGDGMVSDAQNWLDNSGDNFGWILLGNEIQKPSAKRFVSKDSGDASKHPVLTLSFALATPTTITLPEDIQPPEDTKPSTGSPPIFEGQAATYDLKQQTLRIPVVEVPDLGFFQVDFILRPNALGEPLIFDIIALKAVQTDVYIARFRFDTGKLLIDKVELILPNNQTDVYRVRMHIIEENGVSLFIMDSAEFLGITTEN